MNEPLVTCIVPVFNGERFISEALASIAAQTHRPLQIVVVDDGSNDATAAIVAAHAQAVEYHVQENAGPAAARNRGIRMARGEFVGFLDADDLWHPAKLSVQLERFRARPQLDYCVTHVQNFHARGPERLPVGQALPGYVTQTLLARRSLFDSAGLFDESLAHASETEWFVRAAESGATGELLPQALVERRLHGGNRSQLRAEASHLEYLQLLKQRLDRSRADAREP